MQPEPACPALALTGELHMGIFICVYYIQYIYMIWGSGGWASARFRVTGVWFGGVGVRWAHIRLLAFRLSAQIKLRAGLAALVRTASLWSRWSQWRRRSQRRSRSYRAIIQLRQLLSLTGQRRSRRRRAIIVVTQDVGRVSAPRSLQGGVGRAFSCMDMAGSPTICASRHIPGCTVMQLGHMGNFMRHASVAKERPLPRHPLSSNEFKSV